MTIITKGLNAIFQFFVGDMRVLIGTVVALLLVAIVASWSPFWAGPLLFGLLAITLALALRHEITP